MRFVAVATAAFLLCARGGAAHQPPDISQLGGLDMEGLKQFLGAMVTEMQGMKEEYKKLQYEQNRTQAIETELVRAQGEISWLKKDRDAFQNKTRVVEAELRKENAALRLEVKELRNQNTKDIRRIHARLNQCEADSFAQVVERRQTQEQTPACGREAVDGMLAVCCAAPAGNGHRLQESVGCDSLPPTCSVQCSYQFISIFDSCQDQALMRGLSAEQLADWTSFYAVCSEVEQSAAEMGALQPVNVRMFRIMISSDAAQSQAEMFGGDGQTQPIIGSLPELPPPPPPASTSDSDSTDVEQYHAQCTTANILTCVPECNATHHGFELLATIDGSDAKFSCFLANEKFSWVGFPGGYLGQDMNACVSTVISGAAGTYVLSLDRNADIRTDLTIQPGQIVIIVGKSGLVEPPTWGSGDFIVAETGSLSLTFLTISGTISALHSGVATLDRVTFSTRSYVQVTGSARVSITNSFIDTFSIDVSDNGQLMMESLTMSDVLLATTLAAHVTGAGSLLSVSNITMESSSSPDLPQYLWSLTETWMVGDDGVIIYDEPGQFEVLLGPCEVTESGRCVGRPNGYGDHGEACLIEVVKGGSLDVSSVFQTVDYGSHQSQSCPWEARRDAVTFNTSGNIYSGGTGCGANTYAPGFCTGPPPTGMVVPTGDRVTWHSGVDQVNVCRGATIDLCQISTSGPNYRFGTRVAGWKLCFH
eukprot:SAG11_NODE_2899_length_2853_cov_2.525073_1_plen_705_part_10